MKKRLLSILMALALCLTLLPTVALADNTTGYTVTFDANGGSGSMTAVTCVSGSYTLPACTFNAPTGKQFKCWSMTPDGSGEKISAGSSITVSGNIVLYAVWGVDPASTFCVSFNANGGRGYMVNVEKNGDYELPACTFSAPADKQFKCWAKGSTEGAQYAIGSIFNVTENVTFYAIWENVYTVAVESDGNGTVSASSSAAAEGDIITLTVTPDTGYTLETLTVTDKNGSEIELTDKGDGKYTFKMPASKVTVKATFMEDNSMLNFFVDVPADVYYYDAVRWAAENGITEGVDGTHFAPDATCTRAQAVTFLWRAAGCPESKSSVNPFTDVVEGSYYYDAVLWAAENGITVGVDETHFAPDATCTRAQIVTFLWRATGCPEPESLSSFADVPTGSYYAKAVAWAVEQGITVGTVGGKFSPDAPCTRAQIVTFLYRCLK